MILRKKLANHMDELENLENIAEIFIKQEEDSQALEYYRQALAIAQKFGYQSSEERIVEVINQINSSFSN